MEEHTFPGFEEIQRAPDKETPYVYAVSLPEIKGRFRMLKMGSVAISDGIMECKNDKIKQQGLKHFNELPLIEMNFVMAGTLQQKLGYLPEMIFSKGYHNIMYNIGEWEHNRFWEMVCIIHSLLMFMQTGSYNCLLLIPVKWII